MTLTPRVIIALILGALAVLGALYLSLRNNPNQAQATQQPTRAQATSTHSGGTPTTTTHITLPEATTTIREQVTQDNTATSTASTTLHTPGTKTAGTTLRLVLPYLRAHNSGTTVDSAQVQKLTKQLTDELFTINPQRITASDLTVTSDTSTSSAIAHKRDSYKALKTMLSQKGYELTIYGEAVRDNDADKFNTLSERARIYAEAAKALSDVTVPSDAVRAHVELVNALYYFSAVLEQMALGYDDVMASMAALGMFTDAETAISSAFSRLRTYYILKGVDDVTIGE